MNTMKMRRGSNATGGSPGSSAITSPPTTSSTGDGTPSRRAAIPRSTTATSSARMIWNWFIAALSGSPHALAHSLEGREQRLDVPRLIVPHVVDEKRRRPVHAAAHAAHEVVAHLRLVGVRRQLALEARGVEPELPGVLDQVIVLERELALEQPIVHLPELPLRAGRFGRFGGVLRVQMQLGERKVVEHKSQARAHPLLHFLHDRVGATAMRTLEVAVLDERDGGVRRALHVIPLAHRQRQ